MSRYNPKQVIDNSDGRKHTNNALFGYDNPKAPSVTAYTVNASINIKLSHRIK